MYFYSVAYFSMYLDEGSTSLLIRKNDVFSLVLCRFCIAPVASDDYITCIALVIPDTFFNLTVCHRRWEPQVTACKKIVRHS